MPCMHVTGISCPECAASNPAPLAVGTSVDDQMAALAVILVGSPYAGRSPVESVANILRELARQQHVAATLSEELAAQRSETAAHMTRCATIQVEKDRALAQMKGCRGILRRVVAALDLDDLPEELISCLL